MLDRSTSIRYEWFFVAVVLGFFEFLSDQGQFCGATDCSCFGLCVGFMGFKHKHMIMKIMKSIRLELQS